MSAGQGTPAPAVPTASACVGKCGDCGRCVVMQRHRDELGPRVLPDSDFCGWCGRPVSARAEVLGLSGYVALARGTARSPAQTSRALAGAE